MHVRRRCLKALTAAQVRPALVDVGGPIGCVVQNRRRLDDLSTLALVRAYLVPWGLHTQAVDWPLNLGPTLRVLRFTVAAGRILTFDIDSHFELAAAGCLNQHEDHLVLLGLGLTVPPALVLCGNQLMLEIYQILLRQIAILLIIIVRLELVKHFLELATVLLQLLAPYLTHFVRLFEIFDLRTKFRKLSIFLPLTLVTSILLHLWLLLSLAAFPFHSESIRVGRYPLNVVLLVPLDQVDAFENVSDVVNAALLNLELLHRLVQVELLVRLRPKQMYEFICQLDEAIFLARAKVLYRERPEW